MQTESSSSWRGAPQVPRALAVDPSVFCMDWDAENRLAAVKQGAATLANFVYDGRGRRYQKTAGGVTHMYIHDGMEVAEERLSTGGYVRYFRGPSIDERLASQDQGGVATFYSTDHLGSVRETTNNSGTVTLTRDYDPYGNPLLGSSTAGYALTGREWDPETGLYYYRARYYGPSLARFLSADPLGFRGGANVYAYARNNAVHYGDPLGLVPDCRGQKCKGNEEKDAKKLCEKIKADPKAPDCLKRGCPATVRCNTDPTTCSEPVPGSSRRAPDLGATHGTGDVHLCPGHKGCETILHELLHGCGYEDEATTDNATGHFAPRYCVGL